MNGSQSSDPDGQIAFTSWAQTAGSPTVNLAAFANTNATFTAPTVATDTVLTFRVRVTDNLGAVSADDFVNITIRALTAGQAAVNGRITYARIPVGTVGWNYGGTQQLPSRGITVEVVNAGTNAVISSGPTDSDGFYSLVGTANTTVFVRARAELLKTGAAPTWNVRVQSDHLQSNTLHTARSPDFNAGTGATQNIDILSGWNSTTRALENAARPAAPFAALDTIYQAIGRVQGANPGVNLPSLIVDWATDNTGGRTFFSTSATVGRYITLAGEVNVDTDEYDTQVIAHEYGHYIEDVYGRSDSIGGPHSLGDRLDPRVAWGEGFGYWFAGFITGDPLMVDSFGNGQQQSGSFNIETNTRPNPGWFSEASVWIILWDLYDAANEPGDTLTLGIAPIWSILTGQLRQSEAMTTIFTFIRPLKQANPAEAAQIDTMVGAQSIVAATLDDFGTTETNNAGVADLLPVYRDITVGGGPYSIPSAIPFGTENKLGNRRFLRLDVAAPRSVQITASTAATTQDPDVIVYRRGAIVASGESGANESFTANLAEAGTYIVEVYECNNAGCAGDNPTPANTTITLNLQ